MKIFIYKTIFVTICVFFLYQLTIGKKINFYETKITNLSNDQGREELRNKAREELKKAIEKDQILNTEDKELINKFINKIKNEIKE
jgi:ABC-type dipeptide/oligopeptide/nickel transport system permease component